MELQLLNARDHAGLRLGALPERRPHFVQIVPSEFVSAAATCPIFLTKNAETGHFYAGAMFGFEPGESLLSPALHGDGFTPLDLERQGFYLTDGGVLAVDPRHARFGNAGAALFETDGEPSAALRRLQHQIGRLQAGVAETKAFVEALLAHGLIEPIDISLSFDDGKALSLEGLYTVSLDTLSDLGDAAALDLFRQGYLQLIYAMSGSLKHVATLARLRNDRLDA